MPRRLDAGAAVAAVGGVLLLVSLFLDWYGEDGEGFSAWTVFELIDLALAAIALLSVAAFLRRSGYDRRLPDMPLLVLGGAALMLTASQLVNSPPAVAFSDLGLETGAWLGLAASALILAGGFMSVARVSFAVSVEQRDQPVDAAPEREPDPETETVKLTSPDRSD